MRDYEAQHVGLYTWRVARVHDDKRVGHIIKVGSLYAACDADTIPRRRFKTFNDAFNFITGELTK